MVVTVVLYAPWKSTERRLMEPIPRMQNALQELSVAEERHVIAEILTRLSAIRTDINKRFVPQLLVYRLGAMDMREAMVLFQVIQQLQLTREEIFNGVKPLLETENDDLWNAVRRMLEMVVSTNYGQSPNYDLFVQYFQPSSKSSTDPLGGGKSERLLKWMYQQDPETALRAVVQAIYGRGNDLNNQIAASDIIAALDSVSETIEKQRQGVLPVGVIEPDAAKQIDILSRRDEWWVRLYVVHVCKMHPDLQTDAVVNRLEHDPNPLVRELSASLTPAAEHLQRLLERREQDES
jgi:hypothetical protein